MKRDEFRRWPPEKDEVPKGARALLIGLGVDFVLWGCIIFILWHLF